MAVSTYSVSGSKSTTSLTLDRKVFNEEVKNHELIKLAYISYLAKNRQNSAVTKTRGLISGGGKKPWAQKGTGRARTGSIRNPIWRGGGIIFGPTGHENYVKNLNVQSKRKALRQALSLAQKSNKIIIIEDIIVKDAKTSELIKLMTKIEANRNILLVVDTKTKELIRASNNLIDVKVISAKYLNVFDILNSDSLIITKKALTIITEWLISPSKASK